MHITFFCIELKSYASMVNFYKLEAISKDQCVINWDKEQKAIEMIRKIIKTGEGV